MCIIFIVFVVILITYGPGLDLLASRTRYPEKRREKEREREGGGREREGEGEEKERRERRLLVLDMRESLCVYIYMLNSLNLVSSIASIK